MRSVNWTAIGALAGCIYTVLFVVSVLVLRRQLLAQSFSELYERLQSEKVRQARGRIYELQEQKLELRQWKDEDLDAVETVCQRYDYFAKMVRHKFLPKRLVLRSWAWQIDRLWRAISPFVESRRALPGEDRLWEDFQWLARKSAKWVSKRSSPDILPVD